MKNSILIIAMLFAFSFCKAQTKLTFEPLREVIPPKAITDITYYKTSWADEGDETRAFQTHIFSQWLKMIEDANGLFL